MKRLLAPFTGVRRVTSVLAGFVLLVLGSLYFFDASAQSDPDEKQTVESNLTLGRIAFQRLTGSAGGFSGSIDATNADGTGYMTLSSAGAFIPIQPAWSPDGTQIVYSAQGDIWIGGANITNTSAGENDPSWSVNGKIAYGKGGQIWTMNTDGTAQTQFAAITRSSSNPVWSPDGTKLAFLSNGDIWVINADGTSERQVTTTAGAESSVKWWPDGTKFLFSRGGIRTVNLDGTGEVTISASTNDSQPSVSSDATKIAFKRNTTPSGIYTMDVDGTDVIPVVLDSSTQVPNTSTSRENPAFQPVPQSPNTFIISGRVTHNGLGVGGATVNLSGTVRASTVTDSAGNFQLTGLPPGGNYVVSPSKYRHYFTPANRSFNNLSSNQSGNFEVLAVCFSGNCVKNGRIGFVRAGDIFAINSDATSSNNVTNNPASDNEPSFAPDGSLIFTTNRDGNNEIYRMGSLDTPAVNITNNPASDSNPAYSFDGKSIVFTSSRDGNSEIYRMNPDGSNPVRLTNNTTSDSSPTYSPDGQKILYVGTFTGLPQGPVQRPHLMNADGSNPQVLPPPPTTVFSPQYERLSYAPDGSKIMMTYTPDPSTTVRSTYTMNPDGTNYAAYTPGGMQGTFSPDGSKVAYICCTFDFTNFVRWTEIDGSAGRLLTPQNSNNSVPDWQPIAAPRPTAFDFDGDGRSDQAIVRPSTNDWWYLSSINNAQLASNWGASTDVLAPADYDGDMKTDIAVWRPSTGDFRIVNSFDLTVRIENFGLAGDIPTGGDFDGDGKADVSVYRPGSQGTLYYRASMGNPNGNITFTPWGVQGDKPVVGDYDGDGRSDVAVYRPSNGTWYVSQSSNGQFLAVNFGLANDRPVPADYDGDAKTDFAVYRDGIWYQLRSAQGFAAFQWGIAGDTPTPADYDGDGRADASIFRDGVWWTLKSQNGSPEAVQFGLGTDRPVEAAFVR